MLRIWPVSLLLAACLDSPVTTVPPPTPTTLTTTSLTTPVSPCLATGPVFVGAGPVAGLPQPATDVAAVGSIGWKGFPGCDQVTIEFATVDGAPAVDPPQVDAELLRSVGMVRLRFGPLATAVSDQLVESPLVGKVYVVRSLTGELFVDLHLVEPAEVRVTTQSSPGRVVVELRAGGDPYPAVPAQSNLTVLVTPVPGQVAYPLSVAGYSRHFEANVLARIRAEGTVVVQMVTTAADWTETWGEFAFEIPSGPTGPIELFVGQDSPKDGTEEGVYLELDAG